MTAKTIALMEVDLWKRDVAFLHMAPTYCQAQFAKQAFLDAWEEDPDTADIGSPTFWGAGFAACTLYGCSTPHVPVLILEDPQDMKPQPRDEARTIPMEINGQGPLTLEFKTR